MSEIAKFFFEVQKNIEGIENDKSLSSLTNQWIEKVTSHKYTYNFTWMGRPIIQFPQDIIAMQELIWKVKPDLIIETGIAHGGSLLFYASMMALLGEEGSVLGVDIDIRDYNKAKIEKSPMFSRVKMIQGSSIDESIAKRVYEEAKDKKKILLVLDSNHTHGHVLKELELYSHLVSKDSYLVVFDTIIEDLPDIFFKDRPWSKGNNPKTAVLEFLKKNQRFVVDKEIVAKLQITVAPNGYLKCIKN